MNTVYTIGFRRKPLADFVRILLNAGIETVIDIRLRNTSQLSGYAKRDDLACFASLRASDALYSSPNTWTRRLMRSWVLDPLAPCVSSGRIKSGPALAGTPIPVSIRPVSALLSKNSHNTLPRRLAESQSRTSNGVRSGNAGLAIEVAR
jgi:hypothetical protein